MAGYSNGPGGAYSPGGYYDPNASYGWDQPHTAVSTMPIGGPSGYVEQNPGFAYARFLAGQGIGQGETNFDRWARQEESNVRRAYGAASVTNPNLTFQNFLKTIGGAGEFQNRFKAIDPQQRGESFGQFAPPARWLGNG